jgi:hypothetical protein
MGAFWANAADGSIHEAREAIKNAPVAMRAESRRFMFILYCMMKFQRRVKSNIVSGKDFLYRHLCESHLAKTSKKTAPEGAVSVCVAKAINLRRRLLRVWI